MTMPPAAAPPPEDGAVLAPLRALLGRPAPAGHVLLLTGNRCSCAAVAEEVWAAAASRRRLLVAIGRRPVAPASEEARPPGSLVALPGPPDADPRAWELRTAASIAQARGRGFQGVTVLVAPAEHRPGVLRSVDAALDGAGLVPGSAERYCVFPRAWLRREGPVEALALVREHPDQLVLP